MSLRKLGHIGKSAPIQSTRDNFAPYLNPLPRSLFRKGKRKLTSSVRGLCMLRRSLQLLKSSNQSNYLQNSRKALSHRAIMSRRYGSGNEEERWARVSIIPSYLNSCRDNTLRCRQQWSTSIIISRQNVCPTLRLHFDTTL